MTIYRNPSPHTSLTILQLVHSQTPAFEDYLFVAFSLPFYSVFLPLLTPSTFVSEELDTGS